MKEYFKQLFENMRKSAEDGAYEKDSYGYGFYLMDEHFFLYLFFELCFALSAFLLIWLVEGEFGDFCFCMWLITSFVFVMQIVRALSLAIFKKIKTNINKKSDNVYLLFYHKIWRFRSLVILLGGMILLALFTKIFSWYEKTACWHLQLKFKNHEKIKEKTKRRIHKSLHGNIFFGTLVPCGVGTICPFGRLFCCFVSYKRNNRQILPDKRDDCVVYILDYCLLQNI